MTLSAFRASNCHYKCHTLINKYSPLSSYLAKKRDELWKKCGYFEGHNFSEQLHAHTIKIFLLYICDIHSVQCRTFHWITLIDIPINSVKERQWNDKSAWKYSQTMQKWHLQKSASDDEVKIELRPVSAQFKANLSFPTPGMLVSGL